MGRPFTYVPDGLWPGTDRDGGRQRRRRGLHVCASGSTVRHPSAVAASAIVADLLLHPGNGGPAWDRNGAGPCSDDLSAVWEVVGALFSRRPVAPEFPDARDRICRHCARTWQIGSRSSPWGAAISVGAHG